MRLPRIRKKAEKKEKKTEKKDVKHEMIRNSQYLRYEPMEVEKAAVTISELRCGIIETSIVKSIEACGGTVEINGTWDKVILVLVNAVYNKYGKEHFIDKLIHGHFIHGNNGFQIDKVGVERISYDIALMKKSGKYRTYIMYDGEYQIRGEFSAVCIYEAVLELIRILGYSVDDVKFNVEREETKDV